MPLSKHSTLPELKEYVRKHPELKIKLSQKKASLLTALDAKGHIHRGQRTGKITSKNMPKTTPSKIKMSIKPALNTIDISPIENLMSNRDDVEQFMNVLHIMKERNEERLREAPTRRIVLKAANLVEWEQVADMYPSDEEDQSEEAINKYVDESFNENMFLNYELDLNFEFEWTNSWGLQKWVADLTLKQLLELVDYFSGSDSPIGIEHITDLYFEGVTPEYIIEDSEVKMDDDEIRDEF